MTGDAGDEDRARRLARAQLRMYVAGYAVLVVGSGISYWVYRTAVVDEMADALRANSLNSKNAQGQMEYIGGKANLMAYDIQTWFLGLWHGRQLSHTLAALTIAGALLCFYIAYALPDLPPPHEPGGKR